LIVEMAPPEHSAFLIAWMSLGSHSVLSHFSSLEWLLVSNLWVFYLIGFVHFEQHLVGWSQNLLWNRWIIQSRKPSIRRLSGVNAIPTKLVSILSESGLHLDRNIEAGIAPLTQFFSLFRISFVWIESVARFGGLFHA
jgi:hypothetical protein